MLEELLVSRLGQIQELDCRACGTKTQHRFVSNITSLGAEAHDQRWRFYGWECAVCHRREELARVPELGPLRK